MHVLDSNLKEYIHEAVGICGASAGPFGGARVVENMLPVMRELGLVTIHHADKVNYLGGPGALVSCDLGFGACFKKCTVALPAARRAMRIAR